MANRIRKRLNNFIKNNIEQISEYESLSLGLPVECCWNEIVNYFEILNKLNKSIDFNLALREALDAAIRYNMDLLDILESMVSKETMANNDVNITQQYFKEINTIYNKNHNDYDIEFIPENRDKLIEMNLKSVIMIAKKYQGLGLSLNELISAGNLGLVIAYDKFDPSRSKLKDDVIEATKDLGDEFTYEELYKHVGKFMEYGDIKKKFEERFRDPNATYTHKELTRWINSNIYNAKFNSVATMWIRAYILIEIDNCSRLVKKPKSEIYKDRELYGAYQKETTVDIDAPINDDGSTNIGDLMSLDDDEDFSDIEISEAYDVIKDALKKLLDGVKARDRIIFLKKFGIGLPRPMLPKEIAAQENLSIARISQIFQTVMEQMQKNQVKYDLDPNILFEAVRKIQ